VGLDFFSISFSFLINPRNYFELLKSLENGRRLGKLQTNFFLEPLGVDPHKSLDVLARLIIF
jgi:hypothetical protein